MSDQLSEVAEDSARGGFFLVSGSIAVEIVSAIASILVANFLGPQLYGQYVLAFAIPQLVLLFADMGINQGIVRFAASLRARSEIGQIKQLIKCGMIFKALIGTIIFIITFAFAEGFAAVLMSRSDLTSYVRIASISIVFQVILTTSTSAFVGLDRSEYSALATNIQSVAKAIISLLLVLLGLSVVGAVIGLVAGYLIAGLAGAGLLLYIIERELEEEGKSNFWYNIKKLVSYGMPLYISAILTGFILPYQNVILARFVSDADIGSFKAAQNFVTLITVFSLPIATALLPAFSKLNSTSNSKTGEFFRLANKYATMLIVPAAVMLMIFSSEIVRVIYGSTFESAALFLLMYSPLYFLVGVGYLTLSSLFNGIGETRVVFKTTLVNVVIFVVLAPLLTSQYGVPGLVVAFLVANTVGTSYSSYVAKKRFGIKFATKSIIKIYFVASVASVPALLSLHLIPTNPLFNVGPTGFLNLVIGGFLYLATYATLIPASRVVTLSELEKAAEVTAKIRFLNLIARPLIKYQKAVARVFARTRIL